MEQEHVELLLEMMLCSLVEGARSTPSSPYSPVQGTRSTPCSPAQGARSTPSTSQRCTDDTEFSKQDAPKPSSCILYPMTCWDSVDNPLSLFFTPPSRTRASRGLGASSPSRHTIGFKPTSRSRFGSPLTEKWENPVVRAPTPQLKSTQRQHARHQAGHVLVDESAVRASDHKLTDADEAASRRMGREDELANLCNEESRTTTIECGDFSRFRPKIPRDSCTRAIRSRLGPPDLRPSALRQQAESATRIRMK
jgi:hypothetical protein